MRGHSIHARDQGPALGCKTPWLAHTHPGLGVPLILRVTHTMAPTPCAHLEPAGKHIQLSTSECKPIHGASSRTLCSLQPVQPGVPQPRLR